MKKGYRTEAERMISCRITHRGEQLELQLHHLSAADQDEADRAFPWVKPPVLLGDDGRPIRDERSLPRLDETDAAYLAGALERAINHASFLAVRALGPEAFESRSMDEQMTELRRDFSRAAILAMRDVALSGASVTPVAAEAVKDGLRPTGSEG